MSDTSELRMAPSQNDDASTNSESAFHDTIDSRIQDIWENLPKAELDHEIAIILDEPRPRPLKPLLQLHNMSDDGGDDQYCFTPPKPSSTKRR